jgi:hypothetical protein
MTQGKSMAYAASPFDSLISQYVAAGFAETELSVSPARALIDENDIAQPDGMPYFVETSTGYPIHCEGYAFVCSLRDGGGKLVVHGPEHGLGSHIADSLMDREKTMAWALRVANQIDRDFKMADPSGSPGGRAWRKGHVCEK